MSDSAPKRAWERAQRTRTPSIFLLANGKARVVLSHKKTHPLSKQALDWVARYNKRVNKRNRRAH